MKYYSTRNKNISVDFKTALMQGLSKEGGLFMPESIPALPKPVISEIEKYSYNELNYIAAKEFIGNEIPSEKLQDIVEASINFPAPLIELGDELNILELFHGPTLAFKDFGARFMSKTMEYFNAGSGKALNILVATSGDTGSAVANGFYGAEGINVFILYPSGKISAIQEKQIATLDKNITALEVDGTFDDCQNLVKQAFVHKELNAKLNLTSANSINIARLIPQMFYYIGAYKQLKGKKRKIVVSVPSGNLGNITAGIFSKKMGIPFSIFIGASNVNDSFTEFMNTLRFKPKKSVQTLSNAMDVGNPSNLERLTELYSGGTEKIREDITSSSYNDEMTKLGIKELYEKFNYVIDPHGSVGYLALKNYMSRLSGEKVSGILIETAHPAKFKDAVEGVIGNKIDIPARLAECILKEKKSVKISNSLSELKEILL